jgi:hypothetical protein
MSNHFFTVGVATVAGILLCCGTFVPQRTNTGEVQNMYVPSPSTREPEPPSAQDILAYLTGRVVVRQGSGLQNQSTVEAVCEQDSQVRASDAPCTLPGVAAGFTHPVRYEIAACEKDTVMIVCCGTNRSNERDHMIQCWRRDRAGLRWRAEHKFPKVEFDDHGVPQDHELRGMPHRDW